MVRRRRRQRRPRLTGTPLTRPLAPNVLWCADYKGEFLLANRRYCYPLTITDFASRYLIACEALSTTKERYAFAVFERAFQDLVCRRRFAPITGCRSPRPMPSTASANWRCGGYDWTSASSASPPGTPNRMAGMSDCISR